MAGHELLTIGGVAAILLGMLVVNQLLGRREPRAAEAEGVPDSLLCKFVVHEGSVVGESVAEDGELVILKQAGVFRAVPKARLQPEGAELRLGGQVDWSEAERLGAAWHERMKGEGSEEVAGTMTRSEDVRAPAREAFRQREAARRPGQGEEE